MEEIPEAAFLGIQRCPPHRSGSFVIASAPIMSTIIGSVASLTSRPTRIITPQMISNTPSRLAKNAPAGFRPSRTDRTERLRPEELRTPSPTKISPT